MQWPVGLNACTHTHSKTPPAQLHPLAYFITGSPPPRHAEELDRSPVAAAPASPFLAAVLVSLKSDVATAEDVAPRETRAAEGGDAEHADRDERFFAELLLSAVFELHP